VSARSAGDFRLRAPAAGVARVAATTAFLGELGRGRGCPDPGARAEKSPTVVFFYNEAVTRRLCATRTIDIQNILTVICASS